ncbi:radical SAM protein [Ferrovibrio terrae]|nr:radical SAM protein [Ferrovibrio terrae]
MQQSASPIAMQDLPELVGDHRSYNLVRLGSRFAAVPQALGPVDLAEPTARINPYVLWADDEASARQAIDRDGAWKHFDPLYSVTPLDAFGIPEVIEIEPIHTCNLRCIMCHVSYERITKKRLDIGFLKNLQGLQGKWAKLGHLYEPVAHPQFAEIVHGLTDLGMDIDLVTNGTLFTDALIEKISDCNFRNVTISFDGARATTYERIRQRGNFRQAVDRILAFKKAILARRPDTYFQINYTVLRSNIDEIVEAMEFWDAHGFDHIGFINMVIRDEAEILKQEAVQPALDSLEAALDAATRLVIDEKRRITLSAPYFRHSHLRTEFAGNFPQPGVVMSDNPHARLPVTPSTHFQNGPYPGMQVDCRSPFKFARINYDGDVLLCHQFSVGNILKAPLLELWQNATADYVRSMVKGDVSVCEACEYFRFCIQANDVDSRRDFVSNNAIRILKESWPYNFLTWSGQYYAAPQWLRLTATDLADRQRHGTLGIVLADSQEDAEAAVADVFPPLDHSPPPFWKIEEYRDHNLFACHDRLVAIPVSLGPLNVRKMYGFTLDFRYWPYQRHAIIGSSIVKVKRLIDKKAKLGLPAPRWR